MMPNQKVITKMEDNDDVETTLSSPWFRVDFKNVKLKEVPTNGEEFLLSVINERRNISSVTKCDFDYSNLNKNQSCFFEEVPLASAPETLKPTKEWQNIQVADFSDVRMYISRMLAKSENPDKIKKVNVSRDILKWWKMFFNRHEPTLTCVLGFSAAQLDRGLVMLTEILQEIKPGDTVDRKTGLWIYAFLACKKQPLISDTISIIRDLARQCAEVRSHIDAEQEHAKELVAPLNLIICLVGKYFRQYDLAD